MTPDQREKVMAAIRQVAYTADWNQALDAIAAIMAPQWMPVAGLVRDDRMVQIGYWYNDCEDGWAWIQRAMKASRVYSWIDYTHYAELPAALPEKGGDDARSA
jgi:hypothetical protein